MILDQTKNGKSRRIIFERVAFNILSTFVIFRLYVSFRQSLILSDSMCVELLKTNSLTNDKFHKTVSNVAASVGLLSWRIFEWWLGVLSIFYGSPHKNKNFSICKKFSRSRLTANGFRHNIRKSTEIQAVDEW